MLTPQSITRILGSAYELCEEAAIQIVNVAAEAIYARGIFTLVLSGGVTPKTVYTLLATHHRDEIDWENTLLILGDERLVPIDHRESNTRMVRESLLRKISIPHRNVLLFDPAQPDPVAHFIDRLRDRLDFFDDEIPRFDLAMLGLGEDGHIASLFPGDSSLDCTALATKIHVPENPIPDRVTLTIPAFNNARKLIFLVTGMQKARTVADIAENPRCASPVKRIKLVDGEVYWYLDIDSSSRIKIDT